MIGEKTSETKWNKFISSSSGIGASLVLKANDITTIIGCDTSPGKERIFFSTTIRKQSVFVGNIWDEKKKIIDYYRSMYKEEPFLILATPPCQGMSSNGMGKMLSDYKRKGLRPKMADVEIAGLFQLLKSLKH